MADEKRKSFAAKLEDVRAALADETLSVSLEGKTLSVTYPSLEAYGKRATADMSALEKLGAIASADVTMVGVPSTPKHEHIDHSALTGPQRLTVRFL